MLEMMCRRTVQGTAAGVDMAVHWCAVDVACGLFASGNVLRKA